LKENPLKTLESIEAVRNIACDEKEKNTLNEKIIS